MPVYDYDCPKCGRFEALHKMDEVLTECEKCGSEVKKLISPPRGLIFKGSGFYATDYKGGKDGKPDESSSFGLPPHPNKRETIERSDSGGEAFKEIGSKSGTNYNDNKESGAPVGPDYQMDKKL